MTKAELRLKKLIEVLTKKYHEEDSYDILLMPHWLYLRNGLTLVTRYSDELFRRYDSLQINLENLNLEENAEIIKILYIKYVLNRNIEEFESHNLLGNAA